MWHLEKNSGSQRDKAMIVRRVAGFPWWNKKSVLRDKRRTPFFAERTFSGGAKEKARAQPKNTPAGR
jgi:hypothetical protein